jgi:hypothetical protein
MVEIASHVEKIEYSGKTIFLADYRGMTGSDLIAKMWETVEILKKEYIANNVKILIFSDFTGSFVSRDFMNESYKASIQVKQISKKEAIIGINGIKKVILSAYNNITGRNMRVFDDKDEALAWLTG